MISKCFSVISFILRGFWGVCKGPYPAKAGLPFKSTHWVCSVFLLTPSVCRFSMLFSNPVTPTECPAIRFNSGPVSLELVLGHTSSRVQSHKTALTSDASGKWGPQMSRRLPTWPYVWGCSQSSPFRFDNSLEMTHNSGDCSTFIFIIKDTTQKQPNGGDVYGRLWRGGGRGHRASVSSLTHGCVHQHGSSLNPNM